MFYLYLSVFDTVTFPFSTISLFSISLLHPASLSLPLHPFPFIVCCSPLHFQMRSLPVLIFCYFPQSSCTALLSHSFFLALHHSLSKIGMLNFTLNLPVTQGILIAFFLFLWAALSTACLSPEAGGRRQAASKLVFSLAAVYPIEMSGCDI